MSTTDPSPLIPAEERAAPIGRSAARGLAWSLANNFIGRLGSFLAGIVVVRLISDVDYGLYAIGFVVLTILLSANELGVSVAVVQHRGRVEGIAPTVMTMAVVSSFTLAVVGYFVAPSVAELMGAPEATGLVRLLLACVVLDGVASVPNSLMTRLFQQRKRLVIDTSAFVAGTPVTIGLAATGHGAWSLGWGALVGNAVTTVLVLMYSPVRVRPGWDPSVVRGLLSFGLPLAGASLLLLLMMNVDYVIVGHMLGPAQLGLYLLAFNLCSWPITVLTSALRRVALALFARLSERPGGGREDFARALAVVVGVTVPLCVGLAVLAPAVIELLYGRRWLAAAGALVFLSVLSAFRVAVEVTYDFLAGSGLTRSTVWLHAIWLTALVPALLVGASVAGIRGVAAGHAVVAFVVVGPTLGLLLRRAGVSLSLLASRLARPALGAVAMTATMTLVLSVTEGPLRQVLSAGTAGVIVYGLSVWPLRDDVRRLRTLGKD